MSDDRIIVRDEVIADLREHLRLAEEQAGIARMECWEFVADIQRLTARLALADAVLARIEAEGSYGYEVHGLVAAYRAAKGETP